MIYKTRGFEIREKKCEIRAEYREKRRALPPELKTAFDAKICTCFLQSITYRYANILLLYAPLREEIDCMPIAYQAWADGKIVAFPRCKDGECTMQYHIVEREEDLISGMYGIREPRNTAPLLLTEEDVCTEDHPVCIVPGVVFDRDGYRIGYGKGYYDRFLATFSGVRAGMVYSSFLLPELPRGRFDLSVDVMVTEKGVRAVHAN